MPYPDPGSRLVGRAGLLKELDHKLSDGADPVLLTALQGTGGIGKTQLAARYCWAHRHRYPGGIVWTNMADPQQAPDELASWAEKRPEWFGVDSNAKVRVKAQAVLGRIQNRADALLVLDNVIHPSVLDHDLPGLPNTRPRSLGCKVLITSRERLPDCASIRVDFLPAPADRVLLLQEAKRPEPQGTDAFGLAHLLAMLGGLPLALVMTGRLLAGKEMGFGRLANILEQKGAVRVLAERGTIPADYHEKIGSSLRAVLSEAWDALPSDQPHLKQLMMAIGSLRENVFVPEAVLPFLVEMPAGDPEWDEDLLKDTLGRLDIAQLIERNRERRQIRLHPLIRDFACDRRDGAFPGGLAATVAQHLGTAEHVLATPASSLAEVALALESLASMDGGAKDDTSAIGKRCRMLRLGAHSLIRTADPQTERPDPRQLAYVAGLHGEPVLRAQAEQFSSATPGLSLRWTTALISQAMAHRLRGHEALVTGCAISSDGRLGLSASQDNTLIVWDLASGEQRHRLRGHKAWVYGCAISSDGRLGLSASQDNTLIVWDLASGEQRHRLRGHKAGVTGCAISSDGRLGLSASDDKTLIVWDLASGEQRHRLALEALGTGVALSFDGRTALLGDVRGGGTCFDVRQP